jgi:predicted enzyme related to lactoylglutathione lyase
MGRPVVHFEITAKHAAKLESFYSEMFDWSVVSNSPIRYRQVDTGNDAGIKGGIAQTDGSWPNGALFYVQVDDVREYLAKAESLGGTTLLPATQLSESGKIGIFRDPEGVAVGLLQR